MNILPIELQPFDQNRLHQFLKKEGIACLSTDTLSDYLVLGTKSLKQKIDQKCQQLIQDLHPLLHSYPLPNPDVLTLDLAFCQTLEGEGWDLAWVEAQAFTSMLGSFGSLLAAHQHLGHFNHQTSHDLLPLNVSWHEHARHWMAPHSANVLIEDKPWERVGFGDFQATQYWWGCDIVDWRQLEAQDGWIIDPQNQTIYQHINNRLIFSDLNKEDVPLAKHLYRQAYRVSWHSHPAWYEILHKGSLVEAQLQNHEQCYWIEDSDETLFTQNPQDWVFKEIHGHSSEQVLLSPTLHDFYRLRITQKRWLMQKRFYQIPLGKTKNKIPLYGEIRCMIGLKPSQPPFVLAYLMRLNQNGIATLSHRIKQEGEGLTLLVFPNEHS